MADSIRLFSRGEVRRLNSRVMQEMSLLLNLGADIVSPDMVEEVAAAGGFSRARAYAELLGAICDLDTVGKDRDFFRAYFVPMVREVDPTPLLSDPYYARVRPAARKSGAWELKMQSLRPCEAFVAGDFVVYPDGRMLPQIGFFMEEFPYPAVLENGREWMTLLPNETITTAPALAGARGKVLTYGLGLGYFAVRAAMKTEVASVTVVEKSADAIALYRAAIEPLFPALAGKITVIEGDAFAYAESLAPGQYDVIFADIWHDAGDGREPYLRFKALEDRCPAAAHFYWLEDTLRCYLDESLW